MESAGAPKARYAVITNPHFKFGMHRHKRKLTSKLALVVASVIEPLLDKQQRDIQGHTDNNIDEKQQRAPHCATDSRTLSQYGLYNVANRLHLKLKRDKVSSRTEGNAAVSNIGRSGTETDDRLLDEQVTLTQCLAQKGECSSCPEMFECLRSSLTSFTCQHIGKVPTVIRVNRQLSKRYHSWTLDGLKVVSFRNKFNFRALNFQYINTMCANCNVLYTIEETT